MRVMVTGANGLVGRALVQRLLALGQLNGRPISRLLLLDQQLSDLPSDARLRTYTGTITDVALLRRSLADGADVVFHLDSIPGCVAEENYSLGNKVNLMASLELLDQLRMLSRPTVLVYASSIAVYGAELPTRMGERELPRPDTSYGAHKLMVETAICDLARRGEVDGRVVRLPAIVAHPHESNGLRSAFMSELLHSVASNRPYRCPVSPQVASWWMSAVCCVDNLLHAAQLDTRTIARDRVWQLPVLRLSVEEVVTALANRYGNERRELVSYAPDPALENVLGRFPPIKTTQARALGFRHDGSPAGLLRNTLSSVIASRRAANSEGILQP
ncbi:nucleoside-diphosphate-sugar epimerase [Pseudomonas sp. GM21]|uniref:NAD-dependent epimerase/dehydratase family protein n=1 Tax=Pseudomonas sp. GM21 TaxID=1144325 RepID=UPI0002725907|nr:NAD-dependent epimerase/dehydratase family protein [Pseudomonas sp. GM21]EJM22911.1 nucleoside-diphosphate-sugar epimerase [Pseudomonas sp. GM21]